MYGQGVSTPTGGDPVHLVDPGLAAALARTAAPGYPYDPAIAARHYQPWPVTPAAIGTTLDATKIATGLVQGIADALNTFNNWTMDGPWPAPNNPLDLLRKLADALLDRAEDDDLTRERTLTDNDRYDLDQTIAALTGDIIGAAQECDGPYLVHVGDHDRQLAADLLNAADESERLHREAQAADLCPDCRHRLLSRHVPGVGCLETTPGAPSAECPCTSRV
jgi:hypothetical protein